MGFFNDFKPAILFLSKFLGLYFVLNLAYGFYIESHGSKPDPVTKWVTNQTAEILELGEDDIEAAYLENSRSISIINSGRAVISVFEGCNGLNVIIIFLSFLIAFGPYKRQLLWFTVVGIIIIHISNLARITLLYYVSLNFEDYLYFTHKYLFTAIIYVVIFCLWLFWIINFSKRTN
ncbi:MAG: exosortase family protein XrtF [Bacteroidota bacterium]